MKQLYREGTANYPRLSTDTFFADYGNRFSLRGIPADAAAFVEKYQLLRADLWGRFVQQFRQDSDSADNGWRCEYWGKMMRGACLTYSLTKNPALYDLLAATVRDMVQVGKDFGRISSYTEEAEYYGWDLWGRKYVLLGMQYFLEICDDEALTAEVIASMRLQVDDIMEDIGEGKTKITVASECWRGMNSSSILEPIVRLYSLTGEKKYLDFAKYIVDCGGNDLFNLFDYAYDDLFAPYQYPMTKAYEMTSCFEGLLEYYRVTGVERYRTAVIRFADRVLATDFTVIGCSGCTHELFDHSSVRQANTTNGTVMQETCVTVTLMKFFYQLTLLTGDPKYIDAFEISFYNAYLGSLNTEQVVNPDEILKQHIRTTSEWISEPLPFDSYSPLTAGTRGSSVGGCRAMSDNHYYGCCACIGSAGLGLAPKMALLTARDGFAWNLFFDGSIESETPAGQKIIFRTETGYPRTEKINMTVELPASEKFALRVRIPAWSKNTALTLNGKKVNVTAGYTVIDRTWQNGDALVLTLDLRTVAIRPTPYGHDILMNHVLWGKDVAIPQYDVEDPLAKHHIALQRGPVVLAQENRLGYSVDDPVEIEVDRNGYVDASFPEKDTAPYAHFVELSVPLKGGSRMTVTDYASAGKLWTEESKMAAWMLTK